MIRDWRRTDAPTSFFRRRYFEELKDGTHHEPEVGSRRVAASVVTARR